MISLYLPGSVEVVVEVGEVRCDLVSTKYQMLAEINFAVQIVIAIKPDTVQSDRVGLINLFYAEILTLKFSQS